MTRIAVLHPDLGVGGAERLIVDACLALQDCGHEVKLYTGYHDKTRCFDETRDGTLETRAVGQWIPRTILGKFHALMAYYKMIYIALYLVIFSKHDLILCDQVSACIPIFRLFDWRNRPKILFYCHFPDQLLTQRKTFIKRIYRKPIDMYEEWSTGLADLILVNSNFTSTIVRQTFKSLKNRNLELLFPCVDVEKFVRRRHHVNRSSRLIQDCDKLSKTYFTFLSVNRFERKKDLGIAIEALAECQKRLSADGEKFDVHLIIAGGYDERLKDSVLYYEELKQLVQDYDLESHVTFIESPSEDEKIELFRICHVVIYTPENEHFGIVPLEAMAMLRPVIASASGGPLETIKHGVNGLLCEHKQESFADAMLELYHNHDLSVHMGANGFERVKRCYSYEAFRDNLDKICRSQHNQTEKKTKKKIKTCS